MDQPPRNVKLDRRHKWKPTWAITPGNQFMSGINSNVGGVLRSVPGGERLELQQLAMNSPTSGVETKSLKTTYWSGGNVETLQVAQNSDIVGHRFINTDSYIGPAKPGSVFTAFCIFRPAGDGVLGTSDPRIFSKDQGTAEADHDLMLGLLGTGTYTRARARVRYASGTTTLVLSDSSSFRVLERPFLDYVRSRKFKV